MKKLDLFSTVLLTILITAFRFTSDNPKIVFYKNGGAVEEGNFSFEKGDRLELGIVNKNESVKFRIDSIDLIVIPSQQFQEWKRQEKYWKKYCKTKRFSNKNFLQEPRIQLDFSKIYNKECTRMTITVLGVSEIDDKGNISPSDKFILGNEKSFWHIDRD